VLALNAADALPNAPKEDVVAARALLACAFPVRFDMAGLDDGTMSVGVSAGYGVQARDVRDGETNQGWLQLRKHTKETQCRMPANITRQRFADHAKYAALLDDGTSCG
jgi:hypothetical protein